MSVQVVRTNFLDHVRLFHKSKEQCLNSHVGSDEWEMAYAARFSFDRWAVMSLLALGGMAAVW